MIGVFDSGSGGLTVLKEIKSISPKADIVYFGDLANIPYGSKSPEELGALTVVAIEKLLESGASEIVSACNSVSASVAQPIISLLGRKPFKIIEMVGPAVEELAKSRDKNILVLSTMATKKSGIYTNALNEKGIMADSVAINGLVEAIEGGEREKVKSIISGALSGLLENYDQALLGCTQFPLAEDVFREVLGESVEIINPAHAVATRVALQFDTEGDGRVKFIISKDSEFFRDQVTKLFPGSEISVI